MTVTASYSIGTIKPEFIANGYQPTPQFGSTAVGLDDGGYAVAYGNSFGAGNTPHVSLYGANGAAVVGPLGPYFLPYSGSAAGVGMIGEPDIVKLPDGNVRVTWLGAGTITSTNLHSAVLDPTTGSTVVSQTLISNYDIDEFDTAALSGGNHVYAFKSLGGIYLGMKDASGAHIATYVAGDFFKTYKNIDVTALQDGRFVLTYCEDTAANPISYEIRNANGSAAGAAVLLNATGSSSIDSKPVVTALPGGGFAIAYCDSSVDGDGISLMIVTDLAVNPTPIGPIRVDTDISAIETQPALATLSNGFILVTWSQPASSGTNNIFGRIFDAAGNAITIGGSAAPFAIEKDATNNLDSSVAALLNGQFIATWTDSEPDAGGDSIHAIVRELRRTSQGDAEANTIAGDGLIDLMSGEGGDDSLAGGGSNDQLNGGSGDDNLDGGTGNDVLTGGIGNDTYTVDSQRDRINETAGEGDADTVQAAVSFVLAADDSIEVLQTASADGVNAINLTGNGFAQTITGNAGANILSDGGGAAADTLNGLGGNDTLRGGDGNDTLDGGTGDDSLDGGAGNDILTGGLGNDVYKVDSQRDRVDEIAGEGDSDIVLAAVSFVLAADDSIEGLETASSSGLNAINLTGNGFAQIIVGNAGANILSDGGGGAADTMMGLAGNDVYVVRNAGTIIFEDAGQGTDRVAAAVSFTLAADDSIEVLQTTSAAGVSAINLTGNGYAQTIVGDAGANIIQGGGARDILRGGAGGDTFAYVLAADSAVGAGSDVITDFSNAEADRIDLSAMDANSTAADDQAFVFIGSAAFGGVAGELRAVTTATSAIVWGDLDGDKIADFRILLYGGVSLTDDSFVL